MTIDQVQNVTLEEEKEKRRLNHAIKAWLKTAAKVNTSQEFKKPDAFDKIIYLMKTLVFTHQN